MCVRENREGEGTVPPPWGSPPFERGKRGDSRNPNPFIFLARRHTHRLQGTILFSFFFSFFLFFSLSLSVSFPKKKTKKIFKKERKKASSPPTLLFLLYYSLRGLVSPHIHGKTKRGEFILATIFFFFFVS